jgi:hypothetical protein
MANSNETIEVSSYTNGGLSEVLTLGTGEGEVKNLGDVYRKYNISSQDVVTEVTDSEGVDRRVAVTGRLRDGDAVIIMKAKNKSGI